jgi:hypothetical protein
LKTKTTTNALSVALVVSIAAAAHAAAPVVHHQITVSHGTAGCVDPKVAEQMLDLSTANNPAQIKVFIAEHFSNGDCAPINPGTTVTTGRGYPGSMPPSTMLVELTVPGVAKPIWVGMGDIAIDMIQAGKK